MECDLADLIGLFRARISDGEDFNLYSSRVVLLDLADTIAAETQDAGRDVDHVLDGIFDFYAYFGDDDGYYWFYGRSGKAAGSFRVEHSWVNSLGEPGGYGTDDERLVYRFLDHVLGLGNLENYDPYHEYELMRAAASGDAVLAAQAAEMTEAILRVGRLAVSVDEFRFTANAVA